MSRSRRLTDSTLLSLVAGALFIALASPDLEHQGPFYDELHQATGAFTWTRRIEEDTLADPRWRPIAVPPELTQSPHLAVLGFIRTE